MIAMAKGFPDPAAWRNCVNTTGTGSNSNSGGGGGGGGGASGDGGDEDDMTSAAKHETPCLATVSSGVVANLGASLAVGGGGSVTVTATPASASATALVADEPDLLISEVTNDGDDVIGGVTSYYDSWQHSKHSPLTLADNSDRHRTVVFGVNRSGEASVGTASSNNKHPVTASVQSRSNVPSTAVAASSARGHPVYPVFHETNPFRVPPAPSSSSAATAAVSAGGGSGAVTCSTAPSGDPETGAISCSVRRRTSVATVSQTGPPSPTVDCERLTLRLSRADTLAAAAAAADSRTLSSHSPFPAAAPTAAAAATAGGGVGAAADATCYQGDSIWGRLPRSTAGCLATDPNNASNNNDDDDDDDDDVIAVSRGQLVAVSGESEGAGAGRSFSRQLISRSPFAVAQPTPDQTRDQGCELFLSFVHDRLEQDLPESTMASVVQQNDEYMDRILSLPGLSNPVWAQTGAELRSMADAFASSHQRRELRSKAEHTNLTDITWERFRKLLEELFAGEAGVTQERILVLFFFLADCVIATLRRHAWHHLRRLIEWSLRYIVERVCALVQEAGGWTAVFRSSIEYVFLFTKISAFVLLGLAAIIYIRKNL